MTSTNGSFQLSLGPKLLTSIAGTVALAIGTLATGWNSARNAEANCYMDWERLRTEQRERHEKDLQQANLQSMSACQGVLKAVCGKEVDLTGRD